MSEKTGLTLRDIALRVFPLARDPIGLSERIRHQANIDLLGATSGRGEGTGKHRRYGEDAVFDAAFLTAIQDAGIAPGGAQFLADAQAMSRIAFARLKAAKGKGTAIMELAFMPGGKRTLAVHKVRTYKPQAGATVRIEIDLGLVFDIVTSTTRPG
jgi:hypothetical protein